MLIANFTNYGEEITVDGLWQYDYGQRLQINGLNLPDVFEVHLFWKGLEEAKVVTGYTENNKFYVDIPNESLKQRQAITVYIYLSTPETGKTVNTVMMFVNKRPEPEGFEIPEDIDLFHHTLTAVGEYTRQTKEAAHIADTRATESESWAHGHKLYPERDKDNAKYYADQAKQSASDAEASKQVATQSEQNINNTVTAFDNHVEEKKSEAGTAINKVKDAAVKAVTDQQSTSVQSVKDQTASYITEKETSAKTEIGNYTSEKVAEINNKASEANTTLANMIADGTSLKTQLETTISTADTSKKNLDASNTVAGKTKTALDVSNTTATKTKTDLDASNATASEAKIGLDATNKTATDLVASLGDKITEGTQVKTDIQTTGETAMSNLQAEATKQQEYIKTSIDDTLSISGKAADAAVAGKKIDSLKEDISNKITKFYASNQGEIYITDSDNGKIQDMMLYGKSSQDGTPTPENPVEIKSVVNPTVKVCGKNFYPGSDLIGLTKAYVTDFIPVILHKGIIRISFDAFSDTSNGEYLINVQYFDANKERIGNNGSANEIGNNISHVHFEFDGSTAGNNKELNLQNVSYVKITFDIYDTTATEITYKNIMISATDYNFEPYKPIQTVTLPYTLNAIPVESGGNVTINGQQYIADYVDIEKGKLYRKVKRVNLKDVNDISIAHGFHSNGKGYLSFNIVKNVNKEQKPISNRYKGSTWTSESGCMYIPNDDSIVFVDDRFTDKQTAIKLVQDTYTIYALSSQTEEDLSLEQIKSLKSLSTYYPTTNISVNSEQLDGYTVFNYPISMANGWNYVKKQLNDNRDYIYDMDMQSAEAYVNSEYAVALTELEV